MYVKTSILDLKYLLFVHMKTILSGLENNM